MGIKKTKTKTKDPIPQTGGINGETSRPPLYATGPSPAIRRACSQPPCRKPHGREGMSMRAEVVTPEGHSWPWIPG